MPETEDRVRLHFREAAIRWDGNRFEETDCKWLGTL